MRLVNKTFITWFGCGKIPLAPGTAGSVGALPLCYVMGEYAPLWLRLSFAVGFTALAVYSSGLDQKISKTRDPSYVVVDEVAGMLWSTLFTPTAWLPYLVCFGLFRLFDVVKVFPANVFDANSKTDKSPMRRGAYIVLDDVVAGLFTTLIFGMLKL